MLNIIYSITNYKKKKKIGLNVKTNYKILLLQSTNLFVSIFTILSCFMKIHTFFFL